MTTLCPTPTHPNPFPGDSYTTAPDASNFFCRLFPGTTFYWSMCGTLKFLASTAKSGNWSEDIWVQGSMRILNGLERCGVKISMSGLDVFKKLDGPCVFVGNHMSTLETFLLPGMLRPYIPVTFVVKESLLVYPFFCHVMKATNPIAVARKDPRSDFTTVMQKGCDKLAQGQSVVIFPQSTRRLTLDPTLFNSLGVKLARKAGVPVVPFALRTDAWGMNGLFGLMKDHGPINPAIPVNFAFGNPIHITGNGKAEHAQVYEFIRSHLETWGIDSPKLLPPGATQGQES